MTLRSWVRNPFASRAPRATHQEAARCRPEVEVLEDRLVLAASTLPSLRDVAPEAMQAAVSPTPGTQPSLDLRRVFVTMASSPAYWEKVGGTPARYRAALAKDLLGDRTLPPSVRDLPVLTRAKRRQFLNRLMQTDRFCSVWAHRLARLTPKQGSFTPQQLRHARRLIHQPGGFRKAILFFLNTPQFQNALRNRAVPPPLTPATPSTPTLPPIFTVGTPFINPYAVNRQSLVPVPVTDPAAWIDTLAPPPTPTPRHAPWGNAVVLPEVPYAAITAGQAVQPALTLPGNLISASNLSDGITFQTWFQAKNPGALLTAGLTQSSSDVRYQAPLVYVDSSGKLVAGLFDSTPLTVQQIQGHNPTVFSWQDADDLTRIAAANPLVSQASVVDNTWHHVAFVA